MKDISFSNRKYCANTKFFINFNEFLVSGLCLFWNYNKNKNNKFPIYEWVHMFRQGSVCTNYKNSSLYRELTIEKG